MIHKKGSIIISRRYLYPFLNNNQKCPMVTIKVVTPKLALRKGTAGINKTNFANGNSCNIMQQ